ncbi:14963_t:CDS:2 [Cetraspora pellucida]|uniref:14963_t:CDS:1 n=1 Tax=Cetraspora pellucida TaxID=1433469 RepID=A0A9N9BWB2_9GLOM|nr:14963_t:CDS:2 [Cetraspora pellucida]
MSSLLNINEIFNIDKEEEIEMNNNDININDELDNMLDRILDAMDNTEQHDRQVHKGEKKNINKLSNSIAITMVYTRVL